MLKTALTWSSETEEPTYRTLKFYLDKSAQTSRSEYSLKRETETSSRALECENRRVLALI